MNTTTKRKRNSSHQGHNIAKLRSFLGVKQESLAQDLKLTQQQVSQIEQQEKIDEETLIVIAEYLNIPVDLLKNFDEDAVIYNINHYNVHDNTFSDSSVAQVFNPIEKIVELYERLLESEKNKLNKQ